MKCEACGIRAATVRYAEVVDGVVSSWTLCEQCARERGMTGSLASFSGPFAGILMRLLESGSPAAADEGPTCPLCGRSYGSFRRTGRLGCGGCYEAFVEELRPLLRRIHGSTEHTGRVPKNVEGRHARLKELRRLRRELALAVGAEEYERAAGLRDRIGLIQAGIREDRSPGSREGPSGISRGSRSVDAVDNDV